MTRHRPAGPFLVAVILLVSLDLTAKWWAVNHLAGGSRSLPGPVDLQLSYNTGIAFGLVSDLPSSILVVLTAEDLTGVVHLRRTKHRSEAHTSELKSLMRLPYAVFRLKTKKYQK